MRNLKYYIALDEYERRMIKGSLNNLRNKPIADGRYADVVDEILVKVVNAPIKKFKVRITEDWYCGEKIFKQMIGIYHEENGYFIPNLTLPSEEKPIGIWGQRYLRYIKEHKRLFYINMLTSGKLNSYLADINEQAEELFFRLVKQLTEKEGITEKLKNTDRMIWIGTMNHMPTREIVYADIIYA